MTFTIQDPGVAGLLGQIHDGVQQVPAGGMTAREQLEAVARRVRRMHTDLNAAVVDEFLPELRARGIALLKATDLDRAGRGVKAWEPLDGLLAALGLVLMLLGDGSVDTVGFVIAAAPLFYGFHRVVAASPQAWREKRPSMTRSGETCLD